MCVCVLINSSFIVLYGIQHQYLERCSRFVKAVDTRLKEIKLAKPPPEPVAEISALEIRKRRPSLRERRRSLVKERRERVIKEKPKKKIRDEFPELIEIEDNFFELVRMVMSKTFATLFRDDTIYI